VHTVLQHDGTTLNLRKLAADYDPTDRIGAMTHLQQAPGRREEIVTGLLYIDENR